MNETLYSWRSKFHKVVRQQNIQVRWKILFYRIPQFIYESKSERIIEIDPHLPKLSLFLMAHGVVLPKSQKAWMHTSLSLTSFDVRSHHPPYLHHFGVNTWSILGSHLERTQRTVVLRRTYARRRLRTLCTLRWIHPNRSNVELRNRAQHWTRTVI